MKRKDFIKNSTILASGSLVGLSLYSCNPDGLSKRKMTVPGPNDTINLGIIGLGMRARQLCNEFFRIPRVKILAICDIDDKRLEATSSIINNHYGSGEPACTTYKDFRELLDRPDLDGIVVATPDHWHGIMTVMAIKKGKDVYVEKPVTHTIEEGQAIVHAAKKYERIVQVGSQQRSDPSFRAAVNYVRNGYIGELKVIKEMSGDNFPVPFDLKTVTPPDYMDWDMWMGPSEYHDYNQLLCPDVSVRAFPAWRKYKEWGGGGIADLGAHMYDIAQWAMDMDHSGPIEVIPANSGEADSLTFKYENGVIMKKESFGMGGMSIMFEGTEGWVAAGRWWMKTCDELIDVELEEKTGFVYHSENHYKDWIDCMRSRKQPICHPEIGHRTATICNMANIAEELGEALVWDPNKEKFNTRTANKLKSYTYRGNWNI